MFRRKEETATDPSNPAAAAQPYNGNAHAEETPAAAPAAPAAASASANAQGSSYTPSSHAPAAAAPARPAAAAAAPSEPARTAIPPIPASSYRPTPIAEFNRSPVRSPDAPRAPSAPSAAFTASGLDKSASGKSNRRVLTVGNDILLKGEIATCDRLVIEGRVEAKLSDVHTVEIAEVGSFKGTAEVEDAEVSGVFEGDLIVRNRLVIYASGEVRGNISYGEIEIERGGRLTGQIKTGGAVGGKAKGYDSEKRPAKETAAA
jgi:cytoskeletal protein CcmA (bactofilin family)